MNEKLLKESLDMPPNERVALAEAILASIDHEDEEIRQAWISEVKDRQEAYRKGESKVLDFERILDED